MKNLTPLPQWNMTETVIYCNLSLTVRVYTLILLIPGSGNIETALTDTNVPLFSFPLQAQTWPSSACFVGSVSRPRQHCSSTWRSTPAFAATFAVNAIGLSPAILHSNVTYAHTQVSGSTLLRSCCRALVDVCHLCYYPFIHFEPLLLVWVAVKAN